MIQTSEAPKRDHKVASILAGVAAVYLLLTVITVAGIIIDGPTTITSTSKAQAIPSVCRSYANSPELLSDCVARFGEPEVAPTFREGPDWQMRLVLSGGVTVAASFFASVVLGLSTIVRRL